MLTQRSSVDAQLVPIMPRLSPCRMMITLPRQPLLGFQVEDARSPRLFCKCRIVAGAWCSRHRQRVHSGSGRYCVDAASESDRSRPFIFKPPSNCFCCMRLFLPLIDTRHFVRDMASAGKANLKWPLRYTHLKLSSKAFWHALLPPVTAALVLGVPKILGPRCLFQSKIMVDKPDPIIISAVIILSTIMARSTLPTTSSPLQRFHELEEQQRRVPQGTVRSGVGCLLW